MNGRFCGGFLAPNRIVCRWDLGKIPANRSEVGCTGARGTKGIQELEVNDQLRKGYFSSLFLVRKRRRRNGSLTPTEAITPNRRGSNRCLSVLKAPSEFRKAIEYGDWAVTARVTPYLDSLGSLGDHSSWDSRFHEDSRSKSSQGRERPDSMTGAVRIGRVRKVLGTSSPYWFGFHESRVYCTFRKKTNSKSEWIRRNFGFKEGTGNGRWRSSEFGERQGQTIGLVWRDRIFLLLAFL